VTAEEWIDAYGRAWRARDAEAAARLFTDDAVYRSHPFREPDVGTEAIRSYWSRATSTQEDLDLRLGRPLVDENRAAVEFWAQMNVEGEGMTVAGILVVRFARDGRCEELREAWATAEGRYPPPNGWGR
jgi:hypothetical protein